MFACKHNETSASKR